MQLHAVSSNTGCLGVLPVAQFSNGCDTQTEKEDENRSTHPSSQCLKILEKQKLNAHPKRIDFAQVHVHGGAPPRAVPRAALLLPRHLRLRQGAATILTRIAQTPSILAAPRPALLRMYRAALLPFLRLSLPHRLRCPFSNLSLHPFVPSRVCPFTLPQVLKLREEGVWLENPSRYNGMKLLWYEPKMPRELFPFDTGAGVSGALRPPGAPFALFPDSPECFRFLLFPGRCGRQARAFAFALILKTEANVKSNSRVNAPLHPPADKYLGQVTPWHHAALIQYQLKQLRAAMAVAHVLKRTIVLPHFACLCGARRCAVPPPFSLLRAPLFPPRCMKSDVHIFETDLGSSSRADAECFYYRGLNCTIEGHRLHLPYICPTDHVLWGGGKGLKVPFVEPGFMVRATRDARKISHPQALGLCARLQQRSQKCKTCLCMCLTVRIHARAPVCRTHRTCRTGSLIAPRGSTSATSQARRGSPSPCTFAFA